MDELHHEQKRHDTDTHDKFAYMCASLRVNFTVYVHLDHDCYVSVYSSK